MKLFENFNTSNETSPWFAKHENFVIDLNSPGCEVVQTLDLEDRCKFVESTKDCSEVVLVFNYIHIFYCQMRPATRGEDIFGIFILILVCFTVFTFVGTITDKFFCPPLKIVAKALELSENLAGVTLLTFGNTAPDLILTLVTITGDVSTVYSDLMGSAMFVLGFIAGSIVILRPVSVDARLFTRDVTFPLLAVFYLDYAIKSDRYVTVTESICKFVGASIVSRLLYRTISVILSLYGVYLLVIIFDQVILMRTLRNLTKVVKMQDSITDSQAERLKRLQDEAGIKIFIKPKLGKSANVSQKTRYNAPHRNHLIFSQFINSLKPFEIADYRNGGFVSKVCFLFNTPATIILSVLIPVVDYDVDIRGWSKLLNSLQIIIMPAVLTSIFGKNISISGMSLMNFTFYFTVPLSIFIFFVTRTDRPPKFHLMYAFFSIVGSIAFINIFAQELISIIQVLGIVTYSSESFLGCTLLAWANCVGDLIAGLTIAKQGYARMGLVSCIGGPLFYLTLGLGCTFLYKALTNENHIFEATPGSMGETCTVFVVANLVILLLGSLTTNFNIRVSMGVHMIIGYGLFFMYCFMGEVEFIHPFGTDHTEDYGIGFL